MLEQSVVGATAVKEIDSMALDSEYVPRSISNQAGLVPDLVAYLTWAILHAHQADGGPLQDVGRFLQKRASGSGCSSKKVYADVQAGNDSQLKMHFIGTVRGLLARDGSTARLPKGAMELGHMVLNHEGMRYDLFVKRPDPVEYKAAAWDVRVLRPEASEEQRATVNLTMSSHNFTDGLLNNLSDAFGRAFGEQ